MLSPVHLNMPIATPFAVWDIWEKSGINQGNPKSKILLQKMPTKVSLDLVLVPNCPSFHFNEKFKKDARFLSLKMVSFSY